MHIPPPHLRIGVAFLLLSAFALSLAHAQPGLMINSMRVSSSPEPPITEPTGMVAELINRLGDESPEREEATMQSLLALGPAIQPQLRGALRHEIPAPTFPYLQPQAGYSNIFILDPKLLDPHQKQYALETVLSHLGEISQLQSSVITLHYRNAPLTNVLADFGRQIGAPVEAGSLMMGSLDWVKTNCVTINLDRASYWQAIQVFHDKLGIGQLFENVNRPMFVQNEPFYVASMPRPGREHSVVSGPLQITPVSVELARTLDYGSGTNSALVTLNLQARAEPKVSNCWEHAMVQLDECTDDRGKSLLAEGSSRTFLSNGRNCGWLWDVPVTFTAPAAGRHVRTLKGRYSIALCMDQRYLTITNLMRATGKMVAFDGLRFGILGLNDRNDWNEMSVELSAPAGNPYGNTFTNAPDILNISIFDESGLHIPMPQMEVWWINERVSIYDELRDEASASHYQAAYGFKEVRHEGGRDIIAYTLYFSKRIKPSTLLWLPPSETRWLTVPFELHDLTLP